MKRHALIAVLFVCLSAGLSASAPFAAVQGGFIALSVANVDARAKWYSDTFDLTVVKSRSESPDKKSIATILSGHGLIVELIQHVEAKPLSAAAPGLTRSYQVHGIFKAGIVVSDLDASLRELEARHVDIAFRPFTDDALGVRSFAIRDNAGNFVQFFGK